MISSDKKKNIISVTESAVKRVKDLMESSSDGGALGIRVGVKSGGCSGLAYTFEYASEEKPGDECIACDDNASIFIDPAAVMYLIGTTLDYKEDKMQSGFVFINPNETGRCGCGESFSI